MTKLPNGYGSVHKLSGKRRNPWRARKTVGWEYDKKTGKVKQKYINIGYYETKSLALQALAKYNKDPYDINTAKTTFADVYEKWSEKHFQTISEKTAYRWNLAYSKSLPLHNMRMRDIKLVHLEEVLGYADTTDNIKRLMRSLFVNLFQHAIKYGITDKNYAELCDVIAKPDPVMEREPFSNDEIKTLWKIYNEEEHPTVSIILVGIYTGFRPQELCSIKLSDVNLQEGYIIGGTKTKAGKDRTVPIHSEIYDLIKRCYELSKKYNNDFLFMTAYHNAVKYQNYKKRFDDTVGSLFQDVKHRPHDTRHTFATLGKRAKMNEYILKMIMGHAIADITESVYTHRTLEDLKKEIEKIKAL